MEQENKKIRIFFGGSLFSIQERLFNKSLKQNLEKKGYEVILPQDLGIIFDKDGKIDCKAISERAKKEIIKCDILLANLDGPDQDSGTAVEVGIRIGINKPVVGWRTDIRTIEEDLHWNAMFEFCNKVVYSPGEFGEEEAGFDKLVIEIDKAIKDILIKEI
ncbi:nucleoside 2-deoxyribosyltransferase [Candidatus Parcubacteria bacterium]|nr:nucleoside 2-deoxyribosyltransferase [Candidatus Parcubacteria bacterium]